MANRFNNPDIQFCDEAGLPYIAGTLSFYASGTSTLLNTYSDSALTIANTNPITLDSAGRAGSVFLQNLAYKIVLADANGNQIWTEDPVSTSDFSAVAQFQGFAGNPNGHVSGNQASPGIPASVVWDYTDQLLYICTQTGTASTAVWTAYIPSGGGGGGSVTVGIVTPQGYLTPTSGTPIVPTDVVAATAVLYTPYIGNQLPIYNGTTFTNQTFAELTLTLSSSNLASTLYDVFGFSNSSVITLATGPAWAVSTAGSGSRGTGAGTTQLQRINGIWVNAVSLTARNGANTYTIAANQATYLGTVSIDATPGQVSLYRTYGQSRKWGIWNAYNRVPISMLVGDSSSWSYGTNTWRPSNNAAANNGVVLCGLAEEVITAEFAQRVQTVNLEEINLGIGVNSTTSPTGLFGDLATSNTQVQIRLNTEAKVVVSPSLGNTQLTCLENASGGSVALTGTQAAMLMTIAYRG